MRLLILIAVLGCWTSEAMCATITFNALQPAPVDVPANLYTIAIIDRTIPQDQQANTIEGIFTGEGFNNDNKAIQAALDGLTEQLKASGRFHVVRTSERLVGSGSGGKFPEPLRWKEVRTICRKYEADAVISLETFDTDYIITKGKKAGDGMRFFAKGVAKIDLGIRMYNPQSNTIEDQFHFSDARNFNSESGTLLEAVNGLMNRNNAFSKVSYQAGRQYACRIAPSWVRISREYFKRSKKDASLAMGARFMETNDWDRAIDALEQAYHKGHRKTRGKAAHNLAVVHEILGNLEEAKQWATEAWGNHGHKPSKDYGYWLTRRINQQAVVDRQMNFDDGLVGR